MLYFFLPKNLLNSNIFTNFAPKFEMMLMKTHSSSALETIANRCNSLNTNLFTGGGKSHGVVFNNGISHRRWQRALLLLPLFLSIVGCSKPSETICGVPVQGTPWELAAAIADKGDGTFHPVAVQDRILKDRVFIEGVMYECSDAEEERIIVCHINDEGKVIQAYMVNDLSEE